MCRFDDETTSPADSLSVMLPTDGGYSAAESRQAEVKSRFMTVERAPAFTAQTGVMAISKVKQALS